MAIGKTIQIHSSSGLKTVSDYTKDEKKTTFSVDLQKTVNYDSNPLKTTMPGTNIQLVSGYKCNPDTIQDDFAGPREIYKATHPKQNLSNGKEEIYGIHFVMSFPHIEGLDPQLVHQIGKEFCEKCNEKGIGDFQAVISTHMNTDNLHNHILFNSFSSDGKRKFADNKKTLRMMRELNDELSIKYNLPILNEKTHTYARAESTKEEKARENGRSWKEQIRQDIDAVIDSSFSYQDFEEQMTELGYSFRQKNDGSLLSVTDEEGNRVRLEKLGKEYEYSSIMNRIATNRGVSVAQLKPPKKKEYPKVYTKSIRRYTENGRRRSNLEMLFLKVIEWLKLVIEAFKAKGKTEEAEDAANQTQQIEKSLSLLSKYNISGIADLNSQAKKTGMEMNSLKREIEEIDNLLNKYDEEKETLPEALPMTSRQKRELFSLTEGHNYLGKTKYKDIDLLSAQEAIDYLKASPTPAAIPDLLKKPYVIKPIKKKSEIEGLLKEIQEADRKELEEVNKTYKDLKYIQKNVDFCRRVEQEIKEERSEENPVINEEIFINKEIEK